LVFVENTKSTIIIVAIILLLLAFIIAGVFCFKKRRNEKRAGLHADGSDMKGNQSSSNVRTSVASSTNFGENNDEDESVSHLESVVEDGLSLDNDVSSGKIADEKQQKNRRGGYSKQNFDELE
jgi:cytoskeletal protein RodZ